MVRPQEIVAAQIPHSHGMNKGLGALKFEDCSVSGEVLEAELSLFVVVLLQVRSRLLLGTRLVMLLRLVVRDRLLMEGQGTVISSRLDVVSRLEGGFTWMVVVGTTMTLLLLKFLRACASKLELVFLPMSGLGLARACCMLNGEEFLVELIRVSSL